MTTPTREQVIATQADAALLEAYEKAFAERRAFDSHLFGLKAAFAAGRDQGLREAQAQHIAAHGFDKYGFAAAIEQLRK